MIERHPALAQQGGITPLLIVALPALLLILGLVIDIGHYFINIGRLQNAVDAAALSAAKVLDNTGDTGLAEAEANNAFSLILASKGNGELAGAIAPTVTFSHKVNPFNAQAGGQAYFVRVTVANFTQKALLIQLAGIADLTLNANAVAGPSTPLTATGTPDLAPTVWWDLSQPHTIVLYPDLCC